MDDDNLSLHKIQISGPTLASLIHRVSSSPGDLDGLLFGRVTHILPLTLSDDSSSAVATTTSDHPTLVATVTSFLSFTSTSTFYSPSGQIHSPSLHNLLSTSSTSDRLIGWFSGRRKTHLRPSMRETSVTASLSSNSQLSTLIQNSPNSQPNFTPCIFLLLTTPFQDQLIHTHEYKAFQFRTTSFKPKTLDVVNLGPAFRGHYGNFTPNSPFPDLAFEVKGLNSESMVEDDDVKKGNERLGLLCHEEFKLGRLKNLMGSEAANYTGELEDLYTSMLNKMNQLAKLVEQSSAQVLEQGLMRRIQRRWFCQENRNMKLRYKVAGFE